MSLPTGTVTFLFTDIEGSTRLMQELGDEYVSTQLAHHEILRAAFRSGDGRELRTEGDSFFCVFTSAIDACTSAAKAQRDFASREWPHGKPIRVRVGLHTGEAPLVGDEYIGLDVHHAARVAAAAHGGQVVLSDATHALVRASLPTDLTVRDLGMHRLKDLAGAERLFQLVIEGIPQSFPALRTLDSTPNNLPTQPTSFVGREELVALGKHLLDGTRLLTLTGPGGIGKTRLSLQIAAEALPGFSGGVYFVPLSAVSDAALVPSTIAQAIGIPVGGNSVPLDVVTGYLQDKKVLLVLDNLEQLLPDAALPISELLRATSELRVLASSRAVLRVYGEQELALEPLRLPDLRALPSVATLSQFDAVRLFIERAMAAKPDFQVTNENAPAIAGICERVDGLPLAIELAAARIKFFNPTALLARLEKSLSVLGSGSRDLPGRQQTINGAIAWSYDLLAVPLQRLFARFSVFARGASIEQAESVCGPGEEVGVDVLSGLDELADQSLVRRMPELEEPRVLMLQVLREYASDRLRESGEEHTIRDRHAAVFQELAESAAPNLFGADQKKWLDRLQLEHDNFRAALDWTVSRGDALRAMCLAAAFWRFWQMRGHLREGRARLETILAMPSSREHPAERARALEAAGGVAYWQGDMAAAEVFYDDCLELARAAGDARGLANALYNDSFPAQVTKTDIPKARALLEEAVPIFRQLADEPGIARCLWGLGQCYYRTDDFEAAVPALEEAVALFRRLGDRFGLGWALFVRSLLAFKMDDLATATSNNIEALKIFAGADDISGVVLVLDSMAAISRRDGDALRAARLAGAAEAHEVTSGAGLSTVVGIGEGLRSTEAPTTDESAARAEGHAMTIEQAVAYALATDVTAENSVH